VEKNCIADNNLDGKTMRDCRLDIYVKTDGGMRVIVKGIKPYGRKHADRIVKRNTLQHKQNRTVYGYSIREVKE
jgi:hypothetical protein